MTIHIKEGGLAGGVGRCTYMVKPPDVFTEMFILGAFFGAFLGAFLGEFSFAFVFARDVEWRAIGKLTFTFTLVSTWWGSNCVCKRREVVIILLGRIVSDGLLSGSAAVRRGCEGVPRGQQRGDSHS